MMQAWTPEGMAFLQDAMACCGYYPALARRIAPYLPKQAHVCDAGCGLGGLSVALLPYCRHVTAVDRAAAPLENLRQRAGHDPRLTVRQGDIRCLPPETPYDAMVFCLFGDVEEALTVARQQCRCCSSAVTTPITGSAPAGCRWASRRRTRRIPCAIWAFPIGWSGFRWSSVSPSDRWRMPGDSSGSMTAAAEQTLPCTD